VAANRCGGLDCEVVVQFDVRQALACRSFGDKAFTQVAIAQTLSIFLTVPDVGTRLLAP